MVVESFNKITYSEAYENDVQGRGQRKELDYSGGTIIVTGNPNATPRSNHFTLAGDLPYLVTGAHYVSDIINESGEKSFESTQKDSWFWDEEWQAHERAAEREIEQGQREGPFNLEELMDHLNGLKNTE